jgi:ABC-type multidrug transport system ATPase subunit
LPEQAPPDEAAGRLIYSMLRRTTDNVMRAGRPDFAEDQAANRGAHVVEVVGLVVVYGRTPVLRGVDAVIVEGEAIAVMGPNGAGKSTLLKCLVGAVRPRAGRVRWFGGAITRTACVSRQIGFVGQDFGLYAELTAVENLMFAGRMHGVANVHARAAALLADGEMDVHAHCLTGHLSQGMRQRLAIARALIHDPPLIVLDEPSSHLDVAGRQWLERLFERWRRTGRTVCFAGHDVDQNRRLADRVMRLEAGRVAVIERAAAPSAPWRQSA